MKPDRVMALALLLVGCAAPTIDVSVPADHPASPAAAEAPVREAFAVLDAPATSDDADDEDAVTRPPAAGGGHQHHGHKHHHMGGPS